MVIKVGQTRATIYETPIRGVPHFTLCWYEGATRKRRLFAHIEDAKREGLVQVHQLARGESEIIRLTGIERLEYLRARDCLKELNISLDVAAAEFRDAKRLLKDASVLEAARFFASTKLVDVPEKPVSAVIEEMLVAKGEEGLSARYLRDLRSRLTSFNQGFSCNIASINGASIREWIQNRPIGNRSRNNYRIAIQTLFSFAKSRKYLAPDWHEMDSVPVWKESEAEIEVFTPDEMRILLALAESPLRLYLAIGGFAGLRTAEIERLDWSEINLAQGYIRVLANKSKTGSRRLVPITDNLRAWLMPLALSSGKVVALENIANGIERLITKVNAHRRATSKVPQPEKWTWKHNALRHSFCSYRLAWVKSAAQVALEAGNSPKMIFAHYRELVTEKVAQDWFSLRPENPD